ALAPLCPKTPQLAGCPVLLIFCADLARNQRLTESRGYSFANAHMDGLINGVIDAAMAM
ncbi:MAG TPA: NADPH-dependent oxidoreductase, partial [Alphaproteobacteria bacterium]|nr:NADPH-dependent oxidoreductase [Alphaproteobacteria bacterium]